MSDTPWWKSAVIYQIHPRSFQDANSDDIGDLRGPPSSLIWSRLGVDAIWISPIFPCPWSTSVMTSRTTSISIHCSERWPISARCLRAHTTSASRWCSISYPIIRRISTRGSSKAVASRDNAKRDWYLWRDPGPGGAEPNNWLSQFGGTAWEFDRHTGQYYYHAFFKQQPDLNWRNPWWTSVGRQPPDVLAKCVTDSRVPFPSP
jgi:alpha-glucosidase